MSLAFLRDNPGWNNKTANDASHRWPPPRLAHQSCSKDGKKTAPVSTLQWRRRRFLDKPGGANQVAQELAEARKQNPQATLFPEGIVNIMGYERIQSGDPKGALEILKLNTAAYPDSANAYDSLSDAYLADGQQDLAREYAQKALDKLETDSTPNEDRKKLIRESAKQKLKQLGAKQ